MFAQVMLYENVRIMSLITYLKQGLSNIKTILSKIQYLLLTTNLLLKLLTFWKIEAYNGCSEQKQ